MLFYQERDKGAFPLQFQVLPKDLWLLGDGLKEKTKNKQKTKNCTIKADDGTITDDKGHQLLLPKKLLVHQWLLTHSEYSLFQRNIKHWHQKYPPYRHANKLVTICYFCLPGSPLSPGTDTVPPPPHTVPAETAGQLCSHPPCCFCLRVSQDLLIMAQVSPTTGPKGWHLILVE